MFTYQAETCGVPTTCLYLTSWHATYMLTVLFSTSCGHVHERRKQEHSDQEAFGQCARGGMFARYDSRGDSRTTRGVRFSSSSAAEDSGLFKCDTTSDE
jgi:hypothetical protein